MIKYALVLLVILNVPFKTPAQNTSLEIHGGIISPRHSSVGFSTALQFNYRVNTAISCYLYSGISLWDKHEILIRKEGIIYNNEPNIFESYSADDHFLIPVYMGAKIFFRPNKLFVPFLNFELGYSYLSYNSYEQIPRVSSETGRVVGYEPDKTAKKVNHENLFGVGFGAGISHSISNSINLLLAFKLNSFVNENYPGLFSSRGTYTTFSAGLNYNL